MVTILWTKEILKWSTFAVFSRIKLTLRFLLHQLAEKMAVEGWGLALNDLKMGQLWPWVLQNHPLKRM